VSWINPKTNWLVSDAVTNTDLNRIEENIDLLQKGLKELDKLEVTNNGHIGGDLTVGGDLAVDEDISGVNLELSGDLTLVDKIIASSTVRFLTPESASRGIEIGDLLVSNSYLDRTKVPTNGAYFKGNIVSVDSYAATFYNGSSRDYTNYPLGQILLCVVGGDVTPNQVEKNVSVPVKITSGDTRRYYIVNATTGYTSLSGTWRMKGWIAIEGVSIAMVQRTA